VADVSRIDVLTTPEVAAILQVNRNTVYDLAKAGTLPSYNVGRKLRFTLDDVQAFIEASRRPRPAGPSAAADERGVPAPAAALGAFVIGGRDMLLDQLANYLAAAGVRVLRSYQSCYRELVSLYLGEVQAAAVNLWDGSSGKYNLPYVKRLVPGTPVIVLHLATRTQGLLVRRNNPLDLRTWSDLVRRPLVLANRERGSGSRVLLDEHLRMLEADPYQIKGYKREIASDLAQGALIAGGGADAGIGTERVSHQIDGLDYLPLQTEHLALVVAKTEALERTIRTVRGLLGTEMLRHELVTLPGYDVARLGSKLYET
jgi:putative molybdopterin biosynthesis protein